MGRRTSSEMADEGYVGIRESIDDPYRIAIPITVAEPCLTFAIRLSAVRAFIAIWSTRLGLVMIMTRAKQDPR
jgi:hypothetical protein